MSRRWLASLALVSLGCAAVLAPALAFGERVRVIVETDAGGDPDDEQSLVRFLLYANEWDVEGIIANRATARDGENRNPERTGLGVVRRLLKAYGECHPQLVQHDSRFPTLDYLWQRTVSGYDEKNDGVRLIIEAVDRSESRPVWFCNWGTDHGSAPSSLKRALDQVLRARGPEGYARFKRRLRLSSDDQFGEHTTQIEPFFPLWVDTFRPPVEGQRWYHRFSALTATAGGFDLVRDCLTGHGPLGALYPTNTTHWQKEGDTMTFLYLVPNGLGDPSEPTWGSWAGRYGANPNFPGQPYHWADQPDSWQGTTHRDNTLARWAADLQNDFRARLDWCVKPLREANHPPSPVLNGRAGQAILQLKAAPGATVALSAAGSQDGDGDRLSFEWRIYPEAGTYSRAVRLASSDGLQTVLHVPGDAAGKTIHLLLIARDDGSPPLVRYRRMVLQCAK
jgi:hypothetical protein